MCLHYIPHLFVNEPEIVIRADAMMLFLKPEMTIFRQMDGVLEDILIGSDWTRLVYHKLTCFFVYFTLNGATIYKMSIMLC